MTAPELLKIRYTNWRGETADRTINPIRIWWGNTEWHPTNQWMLEAYDVEKGAQRDFALVDIVFRPALVPASALAELQALRAERDAYKAASEAAHTDITTYLRIVADMTQEAEAAEAELATLRAQVERLTGALRFYADFHENPNDGPWGINSQDFGKEARAALTEGTAP